MKTAPLVALLLAAAPAFAQPTIEVVPTCVVADDAQRMILVRALEPLDQLIHTFYIEGAVGLPLDAIGDNYPATFLLSVGAGM